VGFTETDLNGVEVGLGRHQDGDGRHLGRLGHPVCIDELLVRVVRDLVVDGHQVDRGSPREGHRVGRHLRGPQVERDLSGLDLLNDPLRKPTEAVVGPGGHGDGVRGVLFKVDQLGACGEADGLPLPLGQVLDLGHGVEDLVASHLRPQWHGLPPDFDGGLGSGHGLHVQRSPDDVAVGSEKKDLYT